MLSPDAEDRVLAHAEDAGDATELQRRAEECRAHRLTVLVVIADAGVSGLMSDRLEVGSAEHEGHREDRTHPHGSLWSATPFDEHTERVVRLEVAAHVDAVF